MNKTVRGAFHLILIAYILALTILVIRMDRENQKLSIRLDNLELVAETNGEYLGKLDESLISPYFIGGNDAN